MTPASNDDPEPDALTAGNPASPMDLRDDLWLADVADRLSRTKSTDKVLRFLSSRPNRASSMTASSLAAEIGVTPSTIVRFAQAAGFRGWPDFQTHFRHRYLGTLTTTGVDRALEVDEDGPVQAALAQDVRNLTTLRESLEVGKISAVAERMASSKTLVVSSGSYSAVGEILTQNARFLGYDCSLEARGASHLVGAIMQLRPGDTLVAVSFWRLTNQIVQATKWCREHGIYTVAITDSAFSPLAAEAEQTLTAPTESVAFFQSLIGPISIVYAILAAMHELDVGRARGQLQEAQELYEALDVLHRRARGPTDKSRRD